MKTLAMLYHLMYADFLERTRRYSFLVVLGLTIVVVAYSVPPADAHYVTFDLGDYRGIYNSAWVGTIFALLTSLSLSLGGFYLVNNSVARDQRTGVGQILATTSLRRMHYTVGKALSNFAMLAVIVSVVALAGGMMQVIRGEDLSLNLWALFSPFLVITLPTCAVIAALAVLFENISWLRGGLGNALYFFVQAAYWAVTVAVLIGSGGVLNPLYDMRGLIAPLSQMISSAQAAQPGQDVNFSIGFDPIGAPLRRVRWDGIQWTTDMLLVRLMWIAVAVLITLGAALFFTRFDPARERRHRRDAPHLGEEEPAEISMATSVPASRERHLTPMALLSHKARSGSLLVAELRLLLKEQRWWWYLVAGLLLIAGFFAPPESARQVLLPLAWLWPMLLWSSLGSREVRAQTNQFVFSCVQPLWRQLPITWGVGVLLALGTAGGVAGQFTLAGNWGGLFALCVGALFIPSLALASGVWSGNSKLFEVVYLSLWYLGVVQHVTPLDFMGVTAGAFAFHVSAVYLLITLSLLVIAVFGRLRQLQL